MLLAGAAGFALLSGLSPAIAGNIANTGPLSNDGSRSDSVTSNTGIIDNNGPDGDWTGDILANGPTDEDGNGTINNNDGATWDGTVGNEGHITNAGTWTDGDVTNGSQDGQSYDDGCGCVLPDPADIDNNGPGASWTGTVTDNYGAIHNTQGTWRGVVEVNESNASIENDNGTNDEDNTPVGTGYWYGDVELNKGNIYNDGGGVWTGTVVENDGFIQNDRDFDSDGKAGVGTGQWIGDVDSTNGTILNYGIWQGDVLANGGIVYNTDQWTGTAANNDTGLIVNAANGNNTDVGEVLMAPTWTGDVFGNGETLSGDDLALIQNMGGTWDGNVKANKGTIENEGGIYISAWTGFSTWDGDVETNDGIIINGKKSTWTGDIKANTGTIDNVGGDWDGDVKGNSGTISNGGTVSSSGTILHDGDPTNGQGNDDRPVTIGVWTGDVLGNDGTVDNAAGGEWDGDVKGNAADGAITNEGTWTGDVTANSGTISTTGSWDGDFTSAGIVNAQGHIDGAFTNDGTLNLTGGLTGITALTNNGTFDMTAAGVGQSTTVGSASFGSASIWDVALNASPASNQLNVTGNAALGGTLNVTAGTGFTYDRSTTYTILAAGSVTGTFGSVTTDLAFLTPRLSTDGGVVELTMLRNDIGYADVGVTPNQQATAAALEALGSQSPLFQAILGLTAPQAQAAFDQLSGQSLGTAQVAAVQNAGLVTNVVTTHVDQVFDAVGDGDASVSNYADAPALPGSSAAGRVGVWGQVYGGRGVVEAGDVSSSTGGVAGGLDVGGADWRLGVMLQGGSTVTMSGTANSANSHDYGVGLYGGKQWGNTRFLAGVAYTGHDVHSSRQIGVPGLVETLTADYGAGTSQAFARLSQRFDLGAVSLTPYASLDYIRNASDGFTESGGPAALTVDADTTDATLATLGVGADQKFAIGEGKLLTVRGNLGWRHTFADAPDSTQNFAGGTGFTVVGTSVAGDTAVVGAGLALDLNAAATVDLDYEGQIGQSSQTHAVKGNWNARF